MRAVVLYVCVVALRDHLLLSCMFWSNLRYCLLLCIFSIILWLIFKTLWTVNNVMYCTFSVLCCAVLWCSLLFSTSLRCNVMCCAMMSCAVERCDLVYYADLICPVLCCTSMYYSALLCAVIFMQCDSTCCKGMRCYALFWYLLLC
jgi:hypothetical protein